MLIFFAFAIVGAALIIAFVAQSHERLHICADDVCAGRSNGERFCSEEGLVSCILVDGCLRSTARACACTTTDGIASC